MDAPVPVAQKLPAEHHQEPRLGALARADK
jgi:hypothetical protein